MRQPPFNMQHCLQVQPQLLKLAMHKRLKSADVYFDGIGQQSYAMGAFKLSPKIKMARERGTRHVAYQHAQSFVLLKDKSMRLLGSDSSLCPSSIYIKCMLG